MPIQTILDLSTSHITSKDNQLLRAYDGSEKDSGKSLIAYPIDFGWTISTSGMLDGPADREDKIAAMRAEGFSEHFVNLMVHAADLGTVMVRLDRDAEYEPGLPTFDWSNGDEMTPADTAPKP